MILAKKVSLPLKAFYQGKKEKQIEIVTRAGLSDYISVDRANVTRMEIYGKALIEKRVRWSGRSGRVYLPTGWVGSRVKIVKID